MENKSGKPKTITQITTSALEFINQPQKLLINAL